MRFYFKFLFLIVASVGLASCSRIDLALKWADTFLYYELKSVFDFDGKQKPMVEAVSNAVVAEIKKVWLPSVSRRFKLLSEKTDVKAKDEIRSIVDSEVLFAQEHLKKMYSIIADQIPEIQKTITEENWSHFKEEFEEKNVDILSGKPESKLQENLEYFLESLTKEQKNLVKSWVKQNPPDFKLRVENRRHILKQINSKIDPWSTEKWSETIIAWLKEFQGMNLPSYESYIKSRTDSAVALVVDVLHIMTDQQRKDLKVNLLDWHKKLD